MAADSSRPNVLMFAVDDLRPQFGKAFGYEEVGASLLVCSHCAMYLSVSRHLHSSAKRTDSLRHVVGAGDHA